MTLFGNILQNPQDPRARSDVRLMNLVVTFLSMLGAEDENAGVKRMLGVCSEFERIAKAVLDKADKETNTRRKRKSYEEPLPSINLSRPPPPASSIVPTASFPTSNSTAFGANLNPNTFAGTNGNGSTTPNLSWMADTSFNDIAAGFNLDPNNGMTPFGDMSRYLTTNVNSPLNPNTFQQPFVPPDLWQMPMTLEWDWADMTGGPYPEFENGALPSSMDNIDGGAQQQPQHQQ